jgi:type I restriction-modification system DNA methylase subunit
MKIIFNASCILQPLTGIGHFVYQNLKALQTLLKDDLISYYFNEPQPETFSKASMVCNCLGPTKSID